MTLYITNKGMKWKSPWHVNHLMFRPAVSPSCSNFKDSLIVIFLELIQKTRMLGLSSSWDIDGNKQEKIKAWLLTSEFQVVNNL